MARPELYSGAPATLRALSPLAEGADRLFARAALDAGFDLCCVFPFPQSEFEKDFQPGAALEPDSLARFRTLLDEAHAHGRLTRFELDGDRQDAAGAYGTGGRVILNQSDILIVIWDGERLGKRGGTETTLDEANLRGVPIVLVDAVAPHQWRILQRGAAPGDLAATVRGLLELPEARSERAQEALARFYAETSPRSNPGVLWKLFCLLVGGKRKPKSTAQTEVRDLVPALEAYEDWTDRLAVHFSDLYRSAFLLAYLFAAAAVGLAVLPIAMGWYLAGEHDLELGAAVLEIAVIVVILALVIFGRLRRWHERWLDYRFAAELIRQLRLAASLGGERPFPQLSAHLAKYGQPASTWAAWYVRAIARQLGLPQVTVDDGYMRQRFEALRALLDDQAGYHERNAAMCHNIERRLHGAGLFLLSATIVAAVLHIGGSFVRFLPHSPEASGWLMALTAFLPALGAALAGISNQGEFRRIAKRSEALAEHLEGLQAEVQTTLDSGQPLRWQMVADATAHASQLMVNEVLDWRVVFIDRPLNPPS